VPEGKVLPLVEPSSGSLANSSSSRNPKNVPAMVMSNSTIAGYLPLFANRARVGREGVVVREPVVHSDRRRTIEPGEERQLLQMICESVRAFDR
jgi:hypothetical protein